MEIGSLETEIRFPKSCDTASGTWLSSGGTLQSCLLEANPVYYLFASYPPRADMSLSPRVNGDVVERVIRLHCVTQQQPPWGPRYLSPEAGKGLYDRSLATSYYLRHFVIAADCVIGTHASRSESFRDVFRRKSGFRDTFFVFIKNRDCPGGSGTVNRSVVHAWWATQIFFQNL